MLGGTSRASQCETQFPMSELVRIRVAAILVSIGCAMFLSEACACDVGGLRLLASYLFPRVSDVFVADIVDVETLEQGWEKVHVAVTETLTGEVTGTVTLAVRSSTSSNSMVQMATCRPYIGESLLFYVTKREVGPARSADSPFSADANLSMPRAYWEGQLVATSTRFASESAEELDELRRLNRRAPDN